MRLTLLVLACGVLLVGCSLGRGASDKAGGQGRPVTLRLAYTDQAGSAPGRAATYFADRVRELSSGRLRIRILWQAGGFESPRWELAVTDMVRTGEAQLALAPARAWAQDGAASLDALMAPFLITSDEAIRRVVAGPLTKELLGGLKDAGAVGLAMVPGGLRHPFSFADPLLLHADFAGARIRAPYSDIGYDGWRALGARPVDLSGADVAQEAGHRRLVAAESGYGWAGGLTQRSTATGNVTPFARIDVLAAATDVFADLGARDREVLRRAAADMTRHALITGRTDGQLAREFCAAGGRVVLAAEDQVRTLAAATAPVTAGLEREPLTRRVIEAIDSWNVKPPVASGCAPVPAPAPAGGSTSIHTLDGVYRLVWSRREMVRAGISEDYAYGNSGVFTWTLRGGRFVMHQDDPLGPSECRGRYTVRGHAGWVDFVLPCVGNLEGTWSLKGDRLRFSTVNALRDEEVWWGTKPWRRIADAPG